MKLIFFLLVWAGVALAKGPVPSAPAAVKAPRAVISDRTPSSLTPEDRPQLWLAGALDLSRASVSYSPDASLGWGVGAGLAFTLPLAGAWAIEGGVSYQRLSLSRSLDGSGGLQDPSPTVFAQSFGYAGVEALVLARLGSSPLGGALGPLWVEAGGQFLYPLSASQSRNGAAATAFTNTDKLWLVLLGVRAQVYLAPRWSLLTRAQFFYNGAATGGSGYLGLRLGVAVGVAL